MSHLISATLSQEAYDIYKEWSVNRKASANISRAIADSRARESRMEAISIQRNILRTRWEYLENNLKSLLDEGKLAEEILYTYAMQFDHTEMKQDEMS